MCDGSHVHIHMALEKWLESDYRLKTKKNGQKSLSGDPS